MAGPPIRVLVADDDPAPLSALADLVKGEADLELVGIATDADEAIELAREQSPDVALLDVRMPGGGGPKASRAIRALTPPPAVVAVSAYEDRATVLEMVRAGAVGYVVKGSSVEEILDVVRRASGRLPPPSTSRTVTRKPRAREAAPAPPPTSRARVLVVDDEALVRDALADLVDSDPALELVGVAADAGEGLSMAAKHRPDVAVVDVMMPRGGGPRVAREMSAVSPGTRIVTLSVVRERDTVLAMLRAGAMSYLVKGISSVDEVLAAVRSAAAGQAVLSAEITADVVDELVKLSERDRLEIERRRRIEDVLRSGTVTAHLQPVVELRTGRVAGAEALARFPEPVRNPSVWFAEAAAAGLAEDLEIVALRAGLERLDDVPASAWISLNVSPQLVGRPAVVKALAGAESDRLVLEITEHTRVDDYDALREGLAELGAIGVRIAVDDVGAGSGLMHVLEFSPDLLKIDTALIRGIDSDEKRRIVTASMVDLAERGGIGVIAEGIETEAEMRALVDLGVVYGQGYYLGPPGPQPVPERIDPAGASGDR